jgi:hypothetical protein
MRPQCAAVRDEAERYLKGEVRLEKSIRLLPQERSSRFRLSRSENRITPQVVSDFTEN